MPVLCSGGSFYEPHIEHGYNWKASLTCSQWNAEFSEISTAQDLTWEKDTETPSPRIS